MLLKSFLKPNDIVSSIEKFKFFIEWVKTMNMQDEST